MINIYSKENKEIRINHQQLIKEEIPMKKKEQRMKTPIKQMEKIQIKPQEIKKETPIKQKETHKNFSTTKSPPLKIKIEVSHKKSNSCIKNNCSKNN